MTTYTRATATPGYYLEQSSLGGAIVWELDDHGHWFGAGIIDGNSPDPDAELTQLIPETQLDDVLQWFSDLDSDLQHQLLFTDPYDGQARPEQKKIRWFQKGFVRGHNDAFAIFRRLSQQHGFTPAVLPTPTSIVNEQTPADDDRHLQRDQISGRYLDDGDALMDEAITNRVVEKAAKLAPNYSALAGSNPAPWEGMAVPPAAQVAQLMVNAVSNASNLAAIELFGSDQQRAEARAWMERNRQTGMRS